jgi:hypothetical protein
MEDGSNGAGRKAVAIGHVTKGPGSKRCRRSWEDSSGTSLAETTCGISLAVCATELMRNVNRDCGKSVFG